MSENIPQQPQYVVTQRPESGTVTALAVVSIIFGTIGLLGSFIPAALCGAGATYLAKTKGCSIGLPVAAFIVSILGVVISSVQILAISGAVKVANDGVRALDAEMKKDRQEQLQEENTH